MIYSIQTAPRRIADPSAHCGGLSIQSASDHLATLLVRKDGRVRARITRYMLSCSGFTSTHFRYLPLLHMGEVHNSRLCEAYTPLGTADGTLPIHHRHICQIVPHPLPWSRYMCHLCPAASYRKVSRSFFFPLLFLEPLFQFFILFLGDAEFLTCSF